MKQSEKVLKLIESIRKANQASINAASNEDSGTCNMDTVVIDLKDFAPNERKQLFASAYVDMTHYKGSAYFLFFTVLGQANNRTRMIKAAFESMKNDGYDVTIYYQMD